MPGSTNIEAGMKHPTRPDYVRAWWWTRLARFTPSGWSVRPHSRHWHQGEPVTWQGRWWLKCLSTAYYYGELVDGRIPEGGTR